MGMLKNFIWNTSQKRGKWWTGIFVLSEFQFIHAIYERYWSNRQNLHFHEIIHFVEIWSRNEIHPNCLLQNIKWVKFLCPREPQAIISIYFNHCATKGTVKNVRFSWNVIPPSSTGFYRVGHVWGPAQKHNEIPLKKRTKSYGAAV